MAGVERARVAAQEAVRVVVVAWAAERVVVVKVAAPAESEAVRVGERVGVGMVVVLGEEEEGTEEVAMAEE